MSDQMSLSQNFPMILLGLIQLVTVFLVVRLIIKIKELSSRKIAEVDLNLITEKIVVDAIWDFKTDAISERSLDIYVKAKYLDFCSKTGLSPEYLDMVQDSARTLVDSMAVPSKGEPESINLFELVE